MKAITITTIFLVFQALLTTEAKPVDEKDSRDLDKDRDEAIQGVLLGVLDLMDYALKATRKEAKKPETIQKITSMVDEVLL